jgi:hypothetical protein
VLDPREHLGGAFTARVHDVVGTAFGIADAVLDDWDLTPLWGGASAGTGACTLLLLRGTARQGTHRQPWSLILKIVAPEDDQDDPTRIAYWRRERLLYGSGILDALPGGLRAPRCHGSDDLPDGTVWLWLEYVQEDEPRAWSRERWGLAARHLGQLNGAYLSGWPFSRFPWLGGRRLRSWLDRHVPLVTRIAAAPGNPDVRHWWPAPVVAEILRLWDERDVFCDALERLPQTFCHGDAIRRNLFARRRADGADETVAIDWEHAGFYAAGEEVGQTLSVASAFFDVDPSDLPALDATLFTGYLEGLHDAGWRGDPARVRFAYAAHAALRNLFNAVGTSVPDETRRPFIQQNYGHTWEELATRRAAIRPFLLERAAEARRLLPGIDSSRLDTT